MPTAPHEINGRIRSLIDQPVGGQRSAAYADLLALWAEATRDDVEQAA
ncbi:hypothetical protein [Streptomyces turgidiscabies]|uniref:Uncharacterized protein n=1 Tax=Streptomyces turgidiscabies TaxID=85558 RepID=A0ABU0RSL3_9ACTN|nr:hypothetical protein [Streptomyces turgidiscabies]MDQ0934956.1 hypothetical protein [Streptomyces turgidiscabies]